VRLVRHTVLPEDVTSEHDVPFVIGVAVTAAWTLLAGVLTAASYTVGHSWLWQHRLDQLPWIGGLSAFTAVLCGPSIVRRYPQAFVASAREPAPTSGPAWSSEQLVRVPWPTAADVERHRQRARHWALRRLAAVVVPSATAVVTFGAALADLIPLPESDPAFWTALSVWIVLVMVAVLAGFSCHVGTLRAVLPGRAVAAKVREVRPTTRRVMNAWGRRRRPVRDIRAETSEGHVLDLTLLDEDGSPEPGDVVVLVGALPRRARAAPRNRRTAASGLAAVLVVDGRPRALLLRPLPVDPAR